MFTRLLRHATLSTLSAFLLGTLLQGQEMPERPAILGIGHVAFSAHDLEKSRQFYSGFLGLDEVSEWKNADGSTAFTFFKINDHQFVELTPEKQPGTDRFGDVSFETSDVEGMRRYLAARGVTVPDAPTKGRIGNLAFKIIDPPGTVSSLCSICLQARRPRTTAGISASIVSRCT